MLKKSSAQSAQRKRSREEVEEFVSTRAHVVRRFQRPLLVKLSPLFTEDKSQNTNARFLGQKQAS